MDNLVWHYRPVHASDFFIRADLSAHGMPGRFEQLWANREKGRVFRICCVPFFAYGIALRDMVETDDEFTFQRIVSKGGHRTLRVAVANRINEVHLHGILHDWVVKSGLLHEWYSDGYLAVDLPPEIDEAKNIETLDDLERKGEISMEVID
ncbi:MAG: DUF4265 domain-containing protein [Planctomycetaceae bacterium]|nr:DUF4265 domain-containing protein [Planctomycetaceae bacterium]